MATKCSLYGVPISPLLAYSSKWLFNDVAYQKIVFQCEYLGTTVDSTRKEESTYISPDAMIVDAVLEASNPLQSKCFQLLFARSI